MQNSATSPRIFDRAAEFRKVGEMIAAVLDGLRANGEGGNAAVEAAVAERARDLTRRFPIYG